MISVPRTSFVMDQPCSGARTSLEIILRTKGGHHQNHGKGHRPGRQPGTAPEHKEILWKAHGTNCGDRRDDQGHKAGQQKAEQDGGIFGMHGIFTKPMIRDLFYKEALYNECKQIPGTLTEV